MNNLKTLAQLIRQERQPLLSRWRERVRELPSARELDTPTLNDHVPQLLDEIAASLEEGSDETIAEAVAAVTPTAHGVQRAEEGFDIVEVVAEYNILRGCIHDLADQNDVSLRGEAFHILNRVLDGAIGLAVQTFAVQRALEVQRRREDHLSFVAHDLRTPLNAIAVATKVLAHELGERLTEGNSKMLRILSRNADNLGKLITEVLKENTHVEADAGIKLERRSFELWPFVERLIHDMNPIAGTGSVRLVNEVPDDLVVNADAGLLTRIFQNLIANAVVHAPQGEIIIGARQSGGDGTVEIQIEDNGSGIAPERLGSIFEKGETDQKAQGASGLGLHIVKMFVEAHGGIISVESELGAGAMFRFTLPENAVRAGPRAEVRGPSKNL